MLLDVVIYNYKMKGELVMYTAYAINTRTGETVKLGDFIAYDCAWWSIKNRLVWEKDDNPAEWEFMVEEKFNEPD